MKGEGNTNLFCRRLDERMNYGNVMRLLGTTMDLFYFSGHEFKVCEYGSR